MLQGRCKLQIGPQLVVLRLPLPHFSAKDMLHTAGSI